MRNYEIGVSPRKAKHRGIIMQAKQFLTINRVSTILVEFPADQVEPFVEKMFKFYSRSVKYQTSKEVKFTLTFDEYLSLFTSQLLNSLARSFLKGTIEKRQQSDFAFVLSWKNRHAQLAGVMDAESAIVCSRNQSRFNCQYLPDEERSEKARKKMSDKKMGKARPEAVKQKISETKTGQTYDDAHRKAISDGLKGKAKSAESNDRRREAAKAYWAAKRAALNAKAHVSGAQA